MSTPPDESSAGAPQGPAPGWYDDPSSPGRPRWWDGQRWAAPADLPPVGAAPPGAGYGRTIGRPPVDIAQEQQAGRTARTAVLVGMVALLVNAVATVFVLEWLGDYYLDVVDAISRGDAEPPAPPEPSGTVVLANFVSLVSSLGLLVAAIFFLVWFHRAMSNARNLGLPARLSPVWAFLGFIVPVVSLWFPYWCAAGLFPREHAGRRRALRWWLTYLLSGMVTSAAGFVAVVNFPLAMAVLVGGAALILISGLLARSLISEATGLHAELAATSGAGDGASGAAAAASSPVDPWARAAERTDDPWAGP